jgi:hypothetical protein
MTRTGEYVAIDLDENNAYTRAQWAERDAHQAIYHETSSRIAAWLAGLAPDPRGAESAI